jgi:hypothetical protein
LHVRSVDTSPHALNHLTSHYAPYKAGKGIADAAAANSGKAGADNDSARNATDDLKEQGRNVH